ncbi:glycerophosphodiester phosphodiesterase [Arthrobacter sp. H5]|uniref:glycerophosphodiester phosphodiesterase n=1 Tax=Arthrobacter sp. H5 TaxID=1267973 RepID=UPI0004814FB1|nr:glycerophosphodiester phosphodiesterase [Arthrobacter sp. H5]
MRPYFLNVGTAGQQRPLALSHRGFSPEGYENTMAAFTAAIAQGFAFLEIDVRTSRDGVVMVFHDERLDRVTDGTGRVADLTAAELGELRVGGHEGIPTLEEVLRRWPTIRLNVDIKDDAAVVPFVHLIERLQAHDRVLVAAFSDRRRRKVLRGLSRPVASSAGMFANGLVKVLSPLRLTHVVATLARIDCIQVPLTFHGMNVVTPGFVKRCRRAGLPVHVWTINDPAVMRRLLDIGVDGLISDRADLLSRVMEERGLWPQTPAKS